MLSSASEIRDKVLPSWTDKYRFPAGAVLLIFFQLLSGMGGYCYILTMPIYMASILGFSDTHSTIIYHTKSGVSYFLNIFGAVIADSLLGRVKTYLLFDPMYILIVLGLVVISIYKLTWAIIVLYFCLAIVGGCMGPGLRTLIADQIPSDQPVMLSTYLHIIYLVNNFGVIIIAFIAPILHKDIYCFRMECYPLVFTVSFLLILSSFSLFVTGYCCGNFVVHRPTNNLFLNIIRCVTISIKRRITLGKPVNGKSFLDYAEGEFESDFIRDLKIAKGLCVFLLAHPLFWTVFEQLSSIWTLQAQYMDGMITDSFTIKADQMQTLNPILVVILIPFFEILVYPVMDKLNFHVPYRIMAGQIATALACVSMIIIQLRIDASLEPFATNSKMQLNMVNHATTNISIIIGVQNIHLTTSESVSKTIDRDSFVLLQSGTTVFNKTFRDQGRVSTILFLDSNMTGYEVVMSRGKVQGNGGYSLVRAINIVSGLGDIEVILKAKVGINKECVLKSEYKRFGQYVKCDIGEFGIFLEAGGKERDVGTMILHPAETKLIVIEGGIGWEKAVVVRELILKLPKIFWQVVPYILVTIGEVLFNVNTGIFLYGEAPMSMKSILMAGHYVCISIGNLLIMLLKQMLGNVSGVFLFLICSVLVALSGVITGILGYKYLKNKRTMLIDVSTATIITKC